MSAEPRAKSCLRHEEPWKEVSGPICARTSLGVSVMAFLCKTIARRVICIEKAKWSILPFSGVVDTDPFRGNHSRLIRWIVQEKQLVSSQVQAVLRAGDLICPSKPTRSREIGLPIVKQLRARLTTRPGEPAGLSRREKPGSSPILEVVVKRPLSGANEYRLGFSHTSGHDVQHLIHPVDQVYIVPSCGAKQDLGSPRPPLGGVRCQIVRAEIRFGLHDTRLKCLPVNMTHEDLPDQCAG